MKMKRILLAAALMLSAFAANAQVNYKWTTVQMNGDYDQIKDDKATKIIAKYSPLLAPLQEIIGYSKEEYSSRRPESPLSNFAADVIREEAEVLFNTKVDLAMTNFGGIRTSLPKGAVRVYDIYSIFPFDNTIVVFDIKGSDLMLLFKQLARRMEALSNVKIVVMDRKVKSVEIGGEPLDPEKTYKFATINFLMEGGDGVQLKNYATNLQESKIFLRDAIIDYIRKMTAEGRTIEPVCDGRTIVETLGNPAIRPE